LERKLLIFGLYAPLATLDGTVTLLATPIESWSASLRPVLVRCLREPLEGATLARGFPTITNSVSREVQAQYEKNAYPRWFALPKLTPEKLPVILRRKFAQAAIPSFLNEPIEAVGVLHHMEDPLAGWRVLCGLLRLGGFMQIGLYIVPWREPISLALASASRPSASRARRATFGHSASVCCSATGASDFRAWRWRAKSSISTAAGTCCFTRKSIATRSSSCARCRQRSRSSSWGSNSQPAAFPGSIEPGIPPTPP
jgi:hypothetical protein